MYIPSMCYRDKDEAKIYRVSPSLVGMLLKLYEARIVSKISKYERHETLDVLGTRRTVCVYCSAPSSDLCPSCRLQSVNDPGIPAYFRDWSRAIPTDTFRWPR